MSFWRKLKAKANLASFHLTGRRPWSRGYGEYRARELKRVLSDPAFDPECLQPGHGCRVDERIVEYPWFMARLPDGEGVLLDAGSVLNHEFLLIQPKLRSKRVFISTLAPEPVSFNHLGVSYVFEDLRRCCFRDGYFDWVASLSTIEHIGMDNTMLYTADASKRENDPDAHLDAVAQFRRVLRPGGTLYLTMPFGRAQSYDWFQIFDARMVDEVIAAFAPSEARETHYRYTPEGWTRSSRAESKDADYFDVHRAGGHAPDYAAASRAVICLELAK
jgi:hypothetical protein